VFANPSLLHGSDDHADHPLCFFILGKLIRDAEITNQNTRRKKTGVRDSIQPNPLLNLSNLYRTRPAAHEPT